MVTRLPPPDVDCAELVDLVVAERAGGPNAAYFAGLRAEWRQRVEQYSIERGNPETVPDWPAIAMFRTRFLTLYNKPLPNSSQLPVLTELRNRKLQFCPSCGEEGAPNTLDHYLPKERFPHFAITPLNLTPMCDICQQAKKNKFVDGAGNKIFLHPYFDEFPIEQILQLVIGRPFESPTEFQLRPHEDLPGELKGMVQRHMDGLEMDRRYGSFFRDEYLRLLRLAKEAREHELDIRNDIAAFKRLHRRKAHNIWPHIFYAAVEADEELMEYIFNGQLPDKI